MFKGLKRSSIVAVACVIATLNFASAKNLTLPKPDATKANRGFLTLEGEYVLPDEDQVIQSASGQTTINNQKSHDNINFAAGLGFFIKDNMFIVGKYRRLAPFTTFDLTQGDDDSSWIDKWNFNFFDLDLGKSTQITSNVGFHAYIGIGLMKGDVTASYTSATLDPPQQKEKLDILGYGPKLGLGTTYNLTKWFGLVGGVETSFYFTTFKDYLSTNGSPLIEQWRNYHTTLPIIDAYLAANFPFTRNFEAQFGMRAFHSFNFDTNAFMSIYSDQYLANDIGWFGPYVSASLRF